VNAEKRLLEKGLVGGKWFDDIHLISYFSIRFNPVRIRFKGMKPTPYKRHRFQPEIIQHHPEHSP